MILVIIMNTKLGIILIMANSFTYKITNENELFSFDFGPLSEITPQKAKKLLFILLYKNIFKDICAGFSIIDTPFQFYFPFLLQELGDRF